MIFLQKKTLFTNKLINDFFWYKKSLMFILVDGFLVLLLGMYNRRLFVF